MSLRRLSPRHRELAHGCDLTIQPCNEHQNSGRGGEIRTHDLLHPKQARIPGYATPRPNGPDNREVIERPRISGSVLANSTTFRAAARCRRSVPNEKIQEGSSVKGLSELRRCRAAE